MSWKRVHLADIASMRTGKLDSNASVPDGDYPFFTCSQQTLRIDEPAFDTKAVLLGGNNAAGVFPLKYYEGQFNAYQRTYVIESLDPEILNIRFLFYSLMPALSHFQSVSIGVATQYLTKGILDNFQVTLPSISEQDRIASILSAYDDLIENNRQRIQLLEQAARLLYREWFVHLRFPGHEHVTITDGMPEGWGRRELGEICTLRAGGTFKPKYQGQSGGDIPFIKVRDMNSAGNTIAITEAENWVTTDECAEFRGKPFPPETSVFAKIGEALRKNRVRFLVRETLIDNNMMGAIPDRRIVDPPFLRILLSGYDFGGNAGGTAVPFLSAKVLSKERFLVPGSVIRRQFDDVVSSNLAQVTNLQRQNTEAANARNLLLPRLMNGEVAV